MMSASTKDGVCCYYNPYFSDGCTKGSQCEFKHLSKPEYAKYVESKKPKNSRSQSAAYYGFKSAITKFHEHRYDLAAKILKSLLRNNPHIPRYNLWCARTMEKLNLYESAEIYYRRSIAAQPQNATCHGRYAALLHFKLNKLMEAKRHYEIALDLRDDINAVHCHYGKLLCDIKVDNDRAKYHFKKCLQIFEDDEECHFYFGQLLYKERNICSAEYHIKRALYLQSKPYVWHYFYYALVCIELEKYEIAKQHLQICLDLQFAFKSTIWDKIYIEYGLLLIFVFDSLEIGLKYIKDDEIIKLIGSTAIDMFNYKEFRNKLFNNDDVENIMNDRYIAMSDECNESKQPSEGDDVSIESDETEEKEKEIELIKCSVENEFYRFLKSIGFCNYYNKFKTAKINDIRLIEHIDSEFLLRNVGMKQNQISIWNHFINKKWKTECANLCKKWKNKDRFLYTLFYDVFAENGILTIDSFFYYFKKSNDILYLVDNNTESAQNVWSLFQNIQS